MVTTSTKKKRWTLPIRYCLVFILKYVFHIDFIHHIFHTYDVKGYILLASCRRLCNLKNEIHDIGTKILYVQCFVTTDMFLFCKSIFFSGMCRIFRDLAFGSIKTRFKGIWDIFFENLHATLDSQVPFLLDLCPRRATKLWSLQCRHKVLNDNWRCSHSNFIFAKPIRTNETLILFGSKSRLAYKSNRQSPFRPQIWSV